MPLSILRAAPADLESLLLLMRHMQNDDPWAEPFDELWVRKNLAELLCDPRYGLVYLAHDEQTPVAYLVICFDFSLEYRGKGAWIDELFVDPAYRGQGIGTRLLDLAETVSREQGAQTLHLEVSHGNRAIELYRRRAFVDHRRYLMTKWLTFRGGGLWRRRLDAAFLPSARTTHHGSQPCRL
jgi:ribosomal protein S18 acetylase RimI-like enzyme